MPGQGLICSLRSGLALLPNARTHPPFLLPLSPSIPLPTPLPLCHPSTRPRRPYAPPACRTTLLVCLAGILERCNEQTLPALYKYVGRSFRASPRQLGLITLTGAIVQAVCSMGGGLAGEACRTGALGGVWCCWVPDGIIPQEALCAAPALGVVVQLLHRAAQWARAVHSCGAGGCMLVKQQCVAAG